MMLISIRTLHKYFLISGSLFLISAIILSFYLNSIANIIVLGSIPLLILYTPVFKIIIFLGNIIIAFFYYLPLAHLKLIYKYILLMLKIGNLHIKNPIFLAPMAGITDYPYRMICKKYGAGVVYTEFVSANGIIRENQKTLDMIKFENSETVNSLLVVKISVISNSLFPLLVISTGRE